MAHVRSQPAFQTFKHERNVLAKNMPGVPLSSLNDLLPKEGSLMHWCLVQIVRDWEFNVVYLQYYFPSLAPITKMVLVAYLGKYSPNGIGIQGLRLLFDPEYAQDELDSVTESFDDDDDVVKAALEDRNDRITTLDLSFQIDDSNLSLATFARFIAPKASISSDSWQLALPSSRAFPFLSALSLSHPTTVSPTKLWSSLISVLKSQPTLVALSLANWPIPPDMFYSSPHAQAQIYPSQPAISTLQTLSKTAFCLKWIDFSYCGWIDDRVIASAEWSSPGWSSLKTIVLREIDITVCERIREVILTARQGVQEDIIIVT
ncbi:hypothetical protein V1512DRAFT_258881 [Lipomyces arxii]|uniref:uncharacterized protein n=1 Tax=Lipomyces arxii TaxID=56418 RepID=UPI0034CEC671